MIQLAAKSTGFVALRREQNPPERTPYLLPAKELSL
jgi:hypothetical protein